MQLTINFEESKVIVTRNSDGEYSFSAKMTEKENFL